MAGNQFQFVDILAHHFSSFFCNILVAGSVEAISTNSVLFIIFVGNRINIGFGGHGLMESGIKDTNHRCIGHQSLAGINTGKIGGIMKRCQFHTFFQGIDYIRSDQHRGSIFFSRMNDPVADSTNFVHGSYDSMVLIHNGFQNMTDSIRMIGHGSFQLKLFLISYLLVGDDGSVQTDSFNQTFGHQAFCFHIQNLILQR